MIKLFVVGFPPEMQEVELIELFVLYGMIHSINVIKDKVSHRSLGYCFIEMVDQAGADRAVDAINGTIVKGRKITVKLAEKRGIGHKPTVKLQDSNLATANEKMIKKEESGFKPKHKRPRKPLTQSDDKVFSE